MKPILQKVNPFARRKPTPFARPVRTKPRTHYAWRPSEYTEEQFEALLKEYPYINRTPFLDVALSYYLEQVNLHGLDMKTLLPRITRKK